MLGKFHKIRMRMRTILNAEYECDISFFLNSFLYQKHFFQETEYESVWRWKCKML